MIQINLYHSTNENELISRVEKCQVQKNRDFIYVLPYLYAKSPPFRVLA